MGGISVISIMQTTNTDEWSTYSDGDGTTTVLMTIMMIFRPLLSYSKEKKKKKIQSLSGFDVIREGSQLLIHFYGFIVCKCFVGMT
jgi:hypothetical protein